MLALYTKMRNFLSSEKGQGMVEYGMIVGIIAIAVILILGALGGQIGDIFQNILDQLRGNVPATPTAPS